MSARPCAGSGSARTQFGLDRSAVGRRSTHGSSVESSVQAPGRTRPQNASGSGSAVSVDKATAQRTDAPASQRCGGAGIHHRFVDLPTHGAFDRAAIQRPLSCRSHSSVDAFVGVLGSEAGTPSSRTRRGRHSLLDYPRLEAHQKKASVCQGTLVFIDETGVFLTPFVHRTWAPRAQTPILKSRTRHHRHVSVIGAVTISPQRRRLGWYLNFHADQSIRQEQVIRFLRDLLRHVRGRLFLIWDRLNAHRGKQVRSFIAKHSRLHVEFLPAYAPELNPNEYGWSYLKCHSLANYCPDDVAELKDAVQTNTEEIRTQQHLLRGFVQATKLPLRLK
jgi:transposase